MNTPEIQRHSLKRTREDFLPFLVLGTVFFLTASSVRASTWEGVPTGYGLAWSDEFNGAAGSGPNSANWAYDTGGGGWGNSELETYTSSRNNSIIVADANATDGLSLAIIAKSDLTSARIKTAGLQQPLYGYFVSRIRIPYGQGIWPAYWMLGANFPSVGWPTCGEIDIMENIGKPSDQAICHGTLHYNGGSRQAGSSYTLPGGQLLHNDYHIFAALVQTNQIQFFCDGNLYDTLTPSTIDGTWEFNQADFFILNVAIGGTWPGNPDGTTSYPQTMLVDDVRVYQQGSPTPTPVVQSSWYVACGDSSNYVSPGTGVTWAADTNFGFENGLPAGTTNTISNTTDSTLYQFNRYVYTTNAAALTYTFAVPAGSYQVTLKFAEDYFSSPGQRQFNYSINGTSEATNFDIYADAGGQYKADDKVYNNIPPNGSGQIQIIFNNGSQNNAQINAIQIIPQPTPTPTPTACLVGGTPCTPTATFTPTSTPTVTNTPLPVATPLIYPNPAKGVATITVLAPISGVSDVRVQVYTLAFRKVRDQTFSKAAMGQPLSLPLSDAGKHPLANGLYYLLINTNQGKWVTKLLVLQ